MFAAFTGCRQAEWAGLQWGDIDWNRRTAEIRRQWRRGACSRAPRVSKALGHTNVHITLTTYAHAIPRERQGAGDALARLMGQSGNKMETLAPKMRIIVRRMYRK
jgi:integrase